MTQTPTNSRRLSALPGRPRRTMDQAKGPTRDRPSQRKYEIAFLGASGQVEHITRTAPAAPVFEDAFGALGHGAVLQTDIGPVPVEDLVPGDRIRLADGRFDTLLWRGTIVLHPYDPSASAETSSLIRIMADALGYHRPSPDLVLGPTARLFHKAPGVRTLTGSDAAFIPARDFADGIQIIALRPAAPVNVYQLGFDRHERLSVNGLEIESLHPGTAFALGLRGDTLAQYLSLFPHKRNLEAFGTMQNPRLRLRDLDLLDGH